MAHNRWMVLVYELGAEDLGSIKFAISPMTETTLSLRALRDPSRFPLQRPWLRGVRPKLKRVDWDILGWVVNDRMGSPDCLCPPPESPRTDITTELDQIAATDVAVLHRQLEAVHGSIPSALAGSDAVDAMVATLRVYWDELVAPYWSRLRSVMSADIVHRGTVVTEHGTAAMLNGLSDVISYDAGRLRIDRVSNPSRTEQAGGRGLTLLPTMFGPHAAIPFDIGAPPKVLYPPRGQGLMWSTVTEGSTEDLGRLLGGPRARLLQLLAEASSTADLAVRLGVTPSAVSQQLQLLRRNGLVGATRAGRRVLYRRSELGDLLCDERP